MVFYCSSFLLSPVDNAIHSLTIIAYKTHKTVNGSLVRRLFQNIPAAKSRSHNLPLQP